jgi:hypothetical protein
MQKRKQQSTMYFTYLVGLLDAIRVDAIGVNAILASPYCLLDIFNVKEQKGVREMQKCKQQSTVQSTTYLACGGRQPVKEDEAVHLPNPPSSTFSE